MPFNSSGNYIVPAGTEAVNASTVYAEPYNNFLADLKRSISLILPRSVSGAMRSNLPMGANKVENLGTNDGTPYEAWRGGDIIAGDVTTLRTSFLINQYDIIPFASTLDLTGTNHAVVLVEGGGTLRGITGSFEGPRFFIFTEAVNLAESSGFLLGGPGQISIPAEGGVGLWPISSTGSGTLDAWQVSYVYTGEGPLPGYSPPYCYALQTPGLGGLWFKPTTSQWPCSGYAYSGTTVLTTTQNSNTLTTEVSGRRERVLFDFYATESSPTFPGWVNNPSTILMPHNGHATGSYYLEMQTVSAAATGIVSSSAGRGLYMGFVSCTGVSLDFQQNTDFVYLPLSQNGTSQVRTYFAGERRVGDSIPLVAYQTRVGVAVDCDAGEITLYNVNPNGLSATEIVVLTFPELAGRTILPFLGSLVNLSNDLDEGVSLQVTYDFAYLGSEFVWAGHPHIPWIV